MATMPNTAKKAGAKKAAARKSAAKKAAAPKAAPDKVPANENAPHEPEAKTTDTPETNENAPHELARQLTGAPAQADPIEQPPKAADLDEQVEAAHAREGYSPSIGIVDDVSTAAELSEAEARNAGVTGMAVMRSAPEGYGNGAGQEVALATVDDPTYSVSGGSDDPPTGPGPLLGGEPIENKRQRSEAKE